MGERIVITGLSHMTFICRDLGRMTEILTHVLGAEEVYHSGSDTFSVSEEKFFLAGGIWIAVMQGEPLPSRTYNHVAFQIDDVEIEPALERIKSLNLNVKPPRARVPGEGRSIYFYDDDNHLFELHSGTLEQRLASYRWITAARER